MNTLNTAPLMEGAVAEPGERAPTRSSFVERLRDLGDQSVWEGFFTRYGRVVRQVALRSGLNADEAEDVLQETALSVARKMPEFIYERTRCSFEGWVRHVARLRILDQMRRRAPRGVMGGGGASGMLESIPDQAAGAKLDEVWEKAWRTNVLQTALERLQLKVSPEHFQIFYLNVVAGVSGPEVVRTLGVSIAQVYVVRHRLTRLLKREVARLQSTPGGLG